MEKYLPYTEAEYIELKQVIDSISTHMPHDRMGWIWSNHNKILNTKEATPCPCRKAASHWIRAVATIKDFVKGVETNA